MLELLVQHSIEKVLRDYKNFGDDDFKKQVVKEFTKQLYNLDTRSLLTEVTNILYCEKQKEKNFTNTKLHV
ncbi:hypothetical protein PDL02_26370 [Bacillus cereus group sp. LD113LC]|uniref:hypothetical protein n=1 Tax=Bacillus cereus group TaxID=86661 RepID=UPI0019653757|nr:MULTISPECIES: hypothetical protein [Bacillus cereus group]HDR3647213.1 hypothetical protein [Bacillus paranthracis]MCU5562400.1 hypothetical protein [Bacillus pacificus]MDA1625808.1 hypothetical protein [Bacillus cereus group sp. TH206-1LC]MDA1753027.1 hypothetical protein [Bacillus cereus group sp. LD113LC]MDX5917498.1 hypothetical protein [Bacillus cereus group sp. BfR-BA-01026]